MQIFLQLSPQAQVFLVAVFGLIFGSLGSLISYRLSNVEPLEGKISLGRSIVFTRSKCASCAAVLNPFNLIPLISWILQRGKCTKCHAKISWRYPLMELSFLSAFLAIFFVLNRQLDWKMILYFLIAGTLIVMCAIDLEHYFIPDSTQYFLTILVTMLVILEHGIPAVWPHVGSAFVYLGFGLALFVFFYYTAGLEAIGVDDFKFFFVTGFMLGMENFLAFMMLSGICGVVFGSLWQKLKKDETFPFAPAICFSAFVCMLFGKRLDPVELIGSLIF